MAAASGRNRAPLIGQLHEEAWQFEFFQAVRLLQQPAGGPSSEGDSARRPVGHDYAPQQEAVRFRALPSLRFPAGEISHLRAPDQPAAAGAPPGPPEMAVAFLGLTGPVGALPQHYTSLLIERIRGKDDALRDFLDLFNHRLLSLFYRAWEKYRFALAYERTAQADKPEEDLFTRCLYCLVGLGTQGLRGRLALDDEAVLFYAGHFARWPRSAVTLEMLLADYFGLCAGVRQFQGQWLYLEEDNQSSLPSVRRPLGRNMGLGTDVVIGQRVWDVEGRFRVRLGPVDYAQFRQLLPSGDMLDTVCQLARLYVGPHFDFDVQPVLNAAEVPWCRLGGAGAEPARLGWNTWIHSASFGHDADDAIFSSEGSSWTTQC